MWFYPRRAVRPRSRRRLSIAGVVLVFGVSTACSGSGSPAAPSVSGASSPPPAAHIVTTSHVQGRTWDLTVASPGLDAPAKVRLLLPPDFDRDPNRQWPVLYLLHGCCDTYVSWTRSTDIEQLTRKLDVLVVMPDGGKVGFYSDWRTGPRWETFHLTELKRLLAAKYHAGDVEAIAGVSMGGLGALDYAARHPGRFRVAASFSGIVHTRLSSDESQGYLGLVSSQGEDAQALWGDPVADANVWQAHNPYDLAPQLGRTRLFVSAGNGQPGPLDAQTTVPDQTETALSAENVAFAQRVRALHLDAQIDLYGPGTHNWVYWQRELHRAWPMITAGLGVS